MLDVAAKLRLGQDVADLPPSVELVLGPQKPLDVATLAKTIQLENPTCTIAVLPTIPAMVDILRVTHLMETQHPATTLMLDHLITISPPRMDIKGRRHNLEYHSINHNQAGSMVALQAILPGNHFQDLLNVADPR